MKKFFAIAAIAASGFIGYYVGSHHNKDYEAACLFKDIINSAMDDEGIFDSEMQEHYAEWTEDFEWLQFTSLKKEDLTEYCWCY